LKFLQSRIFSYCRSYEKTIAKAAFPYPNTIDNVSSSRKKHGSKDFLFVNDTCCEVQDTEWLSQMGEFREEDLRDVFLFVAQFIFNFDDLTVDQRCRIFLVTLVMFGQAQNLWHNETRDSVKMDENAGTTSTELHKYMTR
jgi:hypothetical protein